MYDVSHVVDVLRFDRGFLEKVEWHKVDTLLIDGLRILLRPIL